MRDGDRLVKFNKSWSHAADSGKESVPIWGSLDEVSGLEDLDPARGDCMPTKVAASLLQNAKPWTISLWNQWRERGGKIPPLEGLIWGDLRQVNLAQVNLSNVLIRTGSRCELMQLQHAIIGKELFLNESIAPQPVKLDASNVSGAILADLSLRQASLRGVDMREATLRNVDLSYTDLTDAVMDGATLDRVRFEGSTLVGASFRNSKLIAIDFRDANADRADFTEARIEQAKLRNTSLRGAVGLSAAQKKDAGRTNWGNAVDAGMHRTGNALRWLVIGVGLAGVYLLFGRLFENDAPMAEALQRYLGLSESVATSVAPVLVTLGKVGTIATALLFAVGGIWMAIRSLSGSTTQS